MTRWFVDTSVAVPLVLSSHEAHRVTCGAVDDRAVEIAAHAALETYSVLTRLPGDARLTTLDAALLIGERFGPVVVADGVWLNLIDDLARVGIAGGAVYDAVIAVTARSVNGVLLTRDHRAAATYSSLNVPANASPCVLRAPFGEKTIS